LPEAHAVAAPHDQIVYDKGETDIQERWRRDHDEDKRNAAKHDIPVIDLVIVNLYPFEQTVAKKGVTLEEAIENIDIGGPSMLRSAAKNHRWVTVICDPADYSTVLAEMKG
jgi:phosphoribosylaminoimidazolecarboxamide formyltransferase/IMP cyclohydrolase